MRCPIRLNAEFWPDLLTAIFPSYDDPGNLITRELSTEDFTKLTSLFRFGKTFKTTASNRYFKTLEHLKTLQFDTPPTILDIGASDGVNSIRLFDILPLKRIYISDLNLEVFYFKEKSRTYFFDANHNWILTATPCWIAFPPDDASLPALSQITTRFFQPKNYKTTGELESLKLINPAVLNHDQKDKIELLRHDIFSNWSRDKVDLVIVANLLNRSYFSDVEIRTALTSLMSSLKPGGHLVIVDNREIEQSSFFQLADGKYLLKHKINDGSDITELVVSLDASQITDSVGA